jgi:hypothetical protein
MSDRQKRWRIQDFPARLCSVPSPAETRRLPYPSCILKAKPAMMLWRHLGSRAATMYTVRRLKLGHSEKLDELARAAGDLYSRTVVSFWRTVRKQGIWLSPAALMRWHTSDALHAHSADAVVQAFCASLKSWRKHRKSDPNARPPRRRRQFFRLRWKSSAIWLRGGYLVLSNGKGNVPLCLRSAISSTSRLPEWSPRSTSEACRRWSSAMFDRSGRS